ncbi:MAG: FAD-dependent 5-carboxymethylaminomethyl-2-thiouridine(34) oxidoreductase MnmC [Burkholderiales bacterium]|nr:FAD-dependent 5-carboxymethylaminomethyl-2-thiouridine(34) oxidoreductase MnmC [Burkholderiales bacterium]
MVYYSNIHRRNINNNKIRPTHWFDKYLNQSSENKVIIIGGGISGASTAYSLATRGYHVTLYEKNTTLASEASGNPQAILYGNFSGDCTPMLELSLSGYQYTHNLITRELTLKKDYDTCGLIQLAYDDKTLKQHKQILSTNLAKNMCYLVTPAQIKSIAYENIKCESGLFFPYGLWVDPRILVNKLVDKPNITVKLNTEIKDLIRKDDGNWQVITANGKIDTATNIILCNSYDLTKFTQFNKIYLRKIRGQLSIIPRNNNLKTIICNNGYITPSNNNSYVIGASFKFNNVDSNIKYQEHLENLNNIKNILPQITTQINLDELQGRVSFRSSTTDYVPLVGPIANYDLFKTAYKDLAKDAKYSINTPCPYLEGLFVNVAHGSKGILTAPLCGEIIADYISNSPLPISEKLRKALHPNRFWVKEIIRGGF